MGKLVMNYLHTHILQNVGLRFMASEKECIVNVIILHLTNKSFCPVDCSCKYEVGETLMVSLVCFIT